MEHLPLELPPIPQQLSSLFTPTTENAYAIIAQDYQQSCSILFQSDNDPPRLLLHCTKILDNTIPLLQALIQDTSISPLAHGFLQECLRSLCELVLALDRSLETCQQQYDTSF